MQDKPDLIIRNADKGGGIVLQDRYDYTKEALHILSDTEYYQQLAENPLKEHQQSFKALINSASHILNKKEYNYIHATDPVIATFYHLPKKSQKYFQSSWSSNHFRHFITHM